MSYVKSPLSIFLLLIIVVVTNSLENLCTSGDGKCPADISESWTYRGYKGPMFWGVKYPVCYGRKQSPINILTSWVQKDENLAQLELKNYEPITKAIMKNTGHTIEVVPSDGVERSITVKGKTYTLQQFHFHWGCVYFKGSEHSVDGKFYAMEMHLVHKSDDDKLAVVGIFLEEGDEDNTELQKLVSPLSDVAYKGTETQLSSSINLNNLVPKNPISYYRYEGSLTTPDCSQGVIWSVAPNPIPVGRSQMNAFRSMYSSTKENAAPGCKLAGNFRPVQPLNGRTVYLSK